jgi:hypothetical protein
MQPRHWLEVARAKVKCIKSASSVSAITPLTVTTPPLRSEKKIVSDSNFNFVSSSERVMGIISEIYMLHQEMCKLRATAVIT